MTYPDGTIQHAGVLLVGYGGGAIHLFRGMRPGRDIYLGLDQVAREVSAVTGACMLVSRPVFDELGGFEESLAVVGNDVDLCLRIWRSGKRVLLEPASSVIHHESQSRSGIDHSDDEERMWARWAGAFEAGDSHYNPNLSSERFDAGLAWERVSARPHASTRADPTSGVNLVGPIRAEIGMGESTRAQARALTAAEVPFSIIDDWTGTPARLGDETWMHKAVATPVFDRSIIHVNADLLPQVISRHRDLLDAGRHLIGYWTWELPRFPKEWRSSMSLVDEIWVPSRFVQQAIDEGATVPVHVVPHAVRVPHGPFLDRRHFDLPDGPVQFLAMYDTQSVIQRKNPEGAIAAFLRAFPDPSNTRSLVIKVNNAGDPELRRLRRLIGDRNDIHLLDATLSRHEMDSLVAASDVFVSLHRSEGFGLPIAEAMALGKPAVVTGWSGNMDFVADECAAIVGYDIVKLAHSYGPYAAGQEWAEPRIDDAVDWMRQLASRDAERERMGTMARERILLTCGAREVAGIVASRLGLPRQPGKKPSLG
jgi:glycosyltransferase involved in cell wall biosynthesis